VTNQDDFDLAWPNPISLSYYKWGYASDWAPAVVRYVRGVVITWPRNGIESAKTAAFGAVDVRCPAWLFFMLGTQSTCLQPKMATSVWVKAEVT